MATVLGLFDNRDNAQRAIEQLRNGSIESNKIGVTMRSPEDAQQVATDTDMGVAGGAAAGAVGGGVLGLIAGLLVGVGTVAIPGVGPVVAGGWLASALIGAGVGAAAGGLVGALVDAGVPEEEAKLYQTGVKRGGVLVTARVPDGQEQAALNILNTNGARNIRNDAGTLYADENYRYGTK